jgi:uncharacterized membrane protein SirB2
MLAAATLSLALVAAAACLANRMVSVLHIAFAWLAPAFALFALQSCSGKLPGASVGQAPPACAGTLGFFASSMLIGMVSRVTLGHSGRPVLADRRDVDAAFCMMQAATALLRVAGELPALPGVAPGPGVVVFDGSGWVPCLVWAAGYAPAALAPARGRQAGLGLCTWLVKYVHVISVVLSIERVFPARPSDDARLALALRARWIKVLPHVNDTCLLVAALIAAAWMSGQYPFVADWVTAKVFGVIAYIILGALALRDASTRAYADRVLVCLACVFRLDRVRGPDAPALGVRAWVRGPITPRMAGSTP